MNTVTLIACCGPKLTHPAPARDLYQSTLFRKARAHAERLGHPWYILSALHGLTHPETILTPYNLTLPKNADGWGWMVAEQLRAEKLRGATLLVLAGERYTLPLLTAGLNVEAPLKGLGIGQQLAYLTPAR